MPDSRLVEQIAQLPYWQGAVNIEPLLGGMTNYNFIVSTANAEKFVVRIGKDLPEHGVMRFNELAASRAAFAAGISPEVVFASQGVMISRYINGRTLTPEDIRNPHYLPAIIDLVKRCHYNMPRYIRGPLLAFWVFQVIRNYLAELIGTSTCLLAPELKRLGNIAEQLERAVGAIQLVFGHNDLLSANFLDDGKRLWLIDWDYAGFNSPLFDLANLSSNNGYNYAQDQALLAGYFGTRLDASCWRSFDAMKCASLMRETLWGAHSVQHSSIDFDYQTYTQDYLVRFNQAWQNFQSRPFSGSVSNG
jgi:thiamine kinase-like enzyme